MSDREIVNLHFYGCFHSYHLLNKQNIWRCFRVIIMIFFYQLFIGFHSSLISDPLCPTVSHHSKEELSRFWCCFFIFKIQYMIKYILVVFFVCKIPDTLIFGAKYFNGKGLSCKKFDHPCS